MNVNEFKNRPVLGILRGILKEMVEPIVETSIASGLKAIEVTMNTDGASELIREMQKISNGRLYVGAGTVLTIDQLNLALKSGATFIVSPVLIKEVASYCDSNKIPFFPGAFTPQEIYNAWRAGATMVKVFPAGKLGPTYFKDIKGPFNDIELLACGGVNEDTIGQFFKNKASAVAFGGGVYKKEWLENKDYKRIGESIKSLIKNFEATVSTI